MSNFCKHTKINTKWCPCKRCKTRVKRSPSDLANKLPVLMSMAERGEVSVYANVYVNWEKGVLDGETAFYRDLDGLPLPKFRMNTTPAKTDVHGNVVSPFYAWQGTVTIPDEALEEAKAVFGEQLKDNVVHSNALTKAVLSMAT